MPCAISHAARLDNVVVLPVPAPARISNVSPEYVAAALFGIELIEKRCGGGAVEHEFANLGDPADSVQATMHRQSHLDCGTSVSRLRAIVPLMNRT
jgi:hypothetical protein